MFAFKKKYFLIIESIKDIDLTKIKRNKKFAIIYRNEKNLEELNEIKKFRKNCALKLIKFYVANNLKLAVQLFADGLYISSYNKSFRHSHIQRKNFDIIGSAHDASEIYLKNYQRCNQILLSKLFKVDYDSKAPYLGVIKFNNYLKISNNLIPLGGIKYSNLNNQRQIKSSGFAIYSEIKKKPAKIINRLF